MVLIYLRMRPRTTKDASSILPQFVSRMVPAVFPVPKPTEIADIFFDNENNDMKQNTLGGFCTDRARIPLRAKNS